MQTHVAQLVVPLNEQEVKNLDALKKTKLQGFPKMLYMIDNGGETGLLFPTPIIWELLFDKDTLRTTLQ